MRARGAKRRSTAIGLLAAFGALTVLARAARRRAARPRRLRAARLRFGAPTRSAASTRAATTSASIGPTPSASPTAVSPRFPRSWPRTGAKLRFAMNAGMFGDDLAPVGLYVEDGKRRERADTRAGASNFHLLPNGVFWIGDGVAGVEETSRYLADAARRRASPPSPVRCW